MFGFALAQTATIINPLGTTDTIPKLLAKITTVVGTVIASLGTIMIVVAGILYLTSAGSPEKTKTAKTALIYAVIGIAIGVSASLISSVVNSVLK